MFSKPLQDVEAQSEQDKSSHSYEILPSLLLLSLHLVHSFFCTSVKSLSDADLKAGEVRLKKVQGRKVKVK